MKWWVWGWRGGLRGMMSGWRGGGEGLGQGGEGVGRGYEGLWEEVGKEDIALLGFGDKGWGLEEEGNGGEFDEC